MRLDKFGYVGICATLALVGWLAGSRQPVEAQQDTTTNSGQWIMFGSNVAGTGGGGGSGGSDILTGLTGPAGYGVYGPTWFYNTASGTVYRVFTACGDDYPDGCMLDVPILTRTEGDASSFVPGSARFPNGSWLGVLTTDYCMRVQRDSCVQVMTTLTAIGHPESGRPSSTTAIRGSA